MLMIHDVDDVADDEWDETDRCRFVLMQDVFVLDAADKCFVWVGKGASPNEKKNGFAYAHVSHANYVSTDL